MICIDDLLSCCRAVELLHYGVDITQLDNLNVFYNVKTKNIQNKISPNIPNFCVKLSNDVKNFLEYAMGDFIVRKEREVYSVFENSIAEEEKQYPIVTLELDVLKDVMTILKRKGWCQFSSYNPQDYDKDYLKHLEEIRKNHNYHDVSECEMIKDLKQSDIRKNLITMLLCAKYDFELAKQILNAFDTTEDSFEIDALKDYEIIDKRIYIKVSEADLDSLKQQYSNDKYLRELKYIVISRNPYDYFFCSYGSNIQSCYSINGTNQGWYGAVSLSPIKGNFLVYGATGKCNKINIISGTKWNVPRMLFRFWGWLADDGRLLLDRCYPSGDSYLERKDHLKILDPLLGYDVYNTCGGAYVDINLKYAKELALHWNKYQCHMYPDSIKVKNFKYYGCCNGDRTFVGTCNIREALLNRTMQINNIPDSLKLTERYTIINGTITNSESCPITHLPLLPDEKVSPFAKFYKEPIESLAVVTYCDGYFKRDIASKDASNPWLKVRDTSDQRSVKDGNSFYFTNTFACCPVSIKVFKEVLTGAAKNGPFASVLVRYIEGDKVTFVKYKGNKQ